MNLPVSLENAHALVIGIAGYPAVRPLPAAVVEDARCIHRALTDPQLCGYPPGHTRLLVDGQAGREDIRRELAALAQTCDRDSTVFLFFSGHGARVAGQVEYLLPYDARFSSAADLASTAISTREFSAALRAIPARKVVVVLDCCHSGGIGQPKTGGEAAPGLSETAYEALNTGNGRAILASSRSDEFSWVLPGDGNSLFTRHLLAGLQGGIASEDGLIKIFDLFEYIQPRVTGEAPHQHPIFKAELEDNFPIALAQGGQKGQPPPEKPPAGEGYRYDAYLVFTPGPGPLNRDAGYVWNRLVPFLKAAGVRLAVSGASEEPGVSLVVGVERAMRQSKRTVLLLSNSYLSADDNLVHFQGALAAAMGVLERKARLLPLIVEPVDLGRVPFWLSSLWPLDLSDPYTGRANLERLAEILKGPVPSG